MHYIDIHSHLNFPEFDSDREETIARAQSKNIGIINVGTDIPMSEKAIELAHAHKNMWATVAIHPTSAGETFDLARLTELAHDPKVVAIGECGLDYFHSEPGDIARQREVFIQHIEIANAVKKPLMLHIRNGKDNASAYHEAIEILKAHAEVRAHFHFFAGTPEDLQEILAIGGSVSFTGVVTFARSYDEVIKNVPSDRILSETDAPYVAPAPYRGKRNEPLYIKEIVKSLAEIRGEKEEVLAVQIIDTARKLFSI